MPDTVAVTGPSTVSLANIAGSPASTFAGLGIMAAPIVSALTTMTLPTDVTGWLRIAFGILAILAHA